MDSDQGKLFIGGISWETSEENLKEYFSNYGDVLQTVVMRDKITGKPRGFAFVSFADPSVIDRVLQDTHTINGRTVEAKRAMSREEQQTSTRTGNSVPVRVSGSGGSMRTKKIFVGGLPATLGEDAFRSYFESYGSVTDVVVMYDQTTQRPRGFGFISFDTEDAVDRVLYKTFHDLNGKQVEVKRALPKDSSPSGGTSRSTSGGSGGASYQGYGGNSSGNSGGYDARSDSSRYMQPQNTGGGFPSYGSSGYSPSGFGYGPTNNGMGYGGYGGYSGGNAGYGGPNSGTAYGNPGGPAGGGYPGGPQGGPRASWTSQAQSGFGGLGYGNAGGYGGGGPGNGGGVQTAQSPSGGAGYGNSAYGYGGGGAAGGYGGGDPSAYGNQSGYGVVGGRGGGSSVPETNVNANAPAGGMGELQGSGGYMGGGGYGNNTNANGGSGYGGHAGWRSETLQGGGNYGGNGGGQGGYGGGYGSGAAQGR